MSEAETAKVAALREALPATGAGIYLDTAARGPLPAETAKAMQEADDWDLRVGRATEGRDEDIAQRLAEARAVVAALVGGDPSEIALTSGIEQAVTIAAWMPDWQPGDRALTVANATPAVLAALHGLRSRLGVELDLVESFSRDAVTERTRLAFLSRPDMVTELESSATWSVIDATNLAGAVPLDVASLGADVIVMPGDRWLLGPEATGALWVGSRARAEGNAGLSGTVGYETLHGSIARPWPDARRFEPGGISRTAVLGLARSVGWLEMYVGLDWALERTQRLSRRLRDSLEDIDGIEFAPTHVDPVAAFTIAGWPVDRALDDLRRRVFAILGVTPDGENLRASVAWFNTEDELDRFAAAVGELAGHTPDTLPRRPPLVVR